ncbi:hypothetical protein [Longimicrobium sp.]|uniref:hypothetical protein n=1 Tax=Longimicrobium sp. TaxID=2029185 RepID=UPI003B3A508E
MHDRSSYRWRAAFLAAGALMLAGGPRHPGGTMAQMLSHPDWVFSHTMMLAGFATLLAGLLLVRGAGPLPPRTGWWLRLAIAATALQTFESVLHLAAYVDHDALVAGRGTPILSTHLALAVIAHPVLAAGIIGLIVAAARERVIGSRWIAPIGIAGAAAHGLAAPLVVAAGDERFRVLFPGIALLALWMVIAALWPARAAAPLRHAAAPRRATATR